MRIRPMSDQRHEARHAEFRALLDSPLHAIEFENSEGQRDLKLSASSNLFAEVKFDTMIVDSRDTAATNSVSDGDIEVLADLRTEYAYQVVGMSAGERGAVSRKLVGNPAAARHEKLIVNVMFAKSFRECLAVAGVELRG